MNLRYKSKFVVALLIVLLMLWLVGVVNSQPVNSGQNNSLYRQVEHNIQARSLRGQSLRQVRGTSRGGMSASGNSRQNILGHSQSAFSQNSTPIFEANWFAVEKPTPKDFRVHDLITIIVNEVSKHTVKADAESAREQTVDFKLEDWLKFTKGNLNPAALPLGDPAIKGSFKRDSQGESDINREDTLSARIQAEVIDVMPNGNLILEATHTVVADDETTTITLTGTCRSKDVGVDNTIISSKIAKLEIRKFHTGMARDSTKRSHLQRFLDFLNPF